MINVNNYFLISFFDLVILCPKAKVKEFNFLELEHLTKLFKKFHKKQQNFNFKKLNKVECTTFK